MITKCPFCGKPFKSAKKHLLKVHKISFKNENDALKFMHQKIKVDNMANKITKENIDKIIKEKDINKIIDSFVLFNKFKNSMDAIENAKNLIEKVVLVYHKTRDKHILGKLYSLIKNSTNMDSVIAIVTLSELVDEQSIPYLIDLADYDELEDWTDEITEALVKAAKRNSTIRDKIIEEITHKLAYNSLRKGQLGAFREILDKIVGKKKSYDYILEYIEKFKDDITMLEKVMDWWGLLFDDFQELKLEPEKVKKSIKILINLAIGTPHEKILREDYKRYNEFLKSNEHVPSSIYGRFFGR